MTSRDIDLFSAESMFRDPIYEELGYIFDPERNEYFELVNDPEHGQIRSYIPPRDIAVQRSIEKSRVGRIYGPGESPFDNREVTVGDRVRDLLFEKQMERSDRLDEYERQQQERLKERERRLQSQSFQSGGAVNDIDIFEETRRMIRDDQTPMMPKVTNEQPMFGMPSQDVRSSQNLGRGARESISVSGTPGIDQVFTQIMTSPDFRSIVRVEDVPPENLQQSKKIFEFLMKRDGIDQAVQYLVDTFGKASMFPIEKSLGPDPRTQRVMGMEKSRMSSDGGDAFARAKARAFAEGSAKGRDRMSGGIGSLMQ